MRDSTKDEPSIAKLLISKLTRIKSFELKLRGAKIATSLMLALVLGLHWSLLQTVAWVGMAVQFSKSDTLANAISKTFDGQHPCSLCKVVKHGRQKSDSPKQAATGKVEIKNLSLWQHDLSPAQSNTLVTMSYPETEVLAAPRADAPPTPPPPLS